jgi:cupin 2 domain-containing protein
VNLFAALPDAGAAEAVDTVFERPGVRVERIVSAGQASPPGFWYDQDRAEWVLVLAGSAGLLLEGEAEPRVLGPGDYLLIPAHRRHRVEWTDAERPTVWLAVHFQDIATGDQGRGHGCVGGGIDP